MLGIAKNTDAVRDYLDASPIVKGYDSTDPALIRFKWDGQPPHEAPPDVYFDLAVAPF